LISDTVSEATSKAEDSMTQSTEIVIPAIDDQHNNSFTINASNSDSDTDSETEGETPPPADKLVEKEATPAIVIETTPEPNGDVPNGEITSNGHVPKLAPAVGRTGHERRREFHSHHSVCVQCFSSLIWCCCFTRTISVWHCDNNRSAKTQQLL